jgi:hypothetical protein
MQLKPYRELKNFKPLYWVGKRLVLSRGYSLYWSDETLSIPQIFSKLPVSFGLRVKSFFRLTERLFRSGIQTAELIDESHLLVVTRSFIWCVNLQTGSVSLDFEIPFGRRILFLTKVIDNNNSSCILFGEYFNNPEKKSVHIWRRSCDKNSSWSIVHTFAEGEINHVHNICVGADSSELFVLTGDFGLGAAIWKTDLSFKKLKPVFRGSQDFRATWLRINNDLLIYATDSQLIKNNLKVVFKLGIGSQPLNFSPIEGSSIYFQNSANGVYFSTAVEPDEPSGNLLKDLFSREIGFGIRSANSVLYFYNFKGALTEVFKAAKDFYPFRLGQFGTFMFPGGTSPENILVVQAVALKRIDGNCLLFNVPSDL